MFIDSVRCQALSQIKSLDLIFSLFMCGIISFANRNNLNFSFPIWSPLISFSCLISLVKVCSTILHISGENGHPCLVPDLSGEVSSLLPFNMILACGFHILCWLCCGRFFIRLSCLLFYVWSSVEFYQMHFLLLLK